jgi:hypothetical protein
VKAKPVAYGSRPKLGQPPRTGYKQSTRALLCLGSWSLSRLVKDSDVEAVTVLDEVEAKIESSGIYLVEQSAAGYSWETMNVQYLITFSIYISLLVNITYIYAYLLRDLKLEP